MKILLFSAFFGILQNTAVTNGIESNYLDQVHLISDAHNASIESRLSDQLFELIDHFKASDPVGLPIHIPDPLEAPDVNTKLPIGSLTMSNVKAEGISKFRVRKVAVELDEMEASVELSFDEIVLTGNYTLKALGTSKGNFIIKVFGLVVSGGAKLAVEKSGKMRTQEVMADAGVTKMDIKFFNLGAFVSAVFQGFINSGDNRMFDTIKPYILSDAKVIIKEKIDEQIEEKIGHYGLMPNSISPVDYVIAEARREAKKRFDPLKVADYQNPGIIGVKLYDTEVTGISSFYRVGDLKIDIKDGGAFVELDIGTQEIHGKSSWELSLAKGIIKRHGHFQFTVQYFKVFIKITQPLDLSKRLVIDELHFDLGNIQIMSSGTGTFDYLVEFFINTIPNLLRYQIMDAIEGPVKLKIQEFTDKIDAEELLREKINEYERDGTINFNFIKVEL